MLKVTVGDTGNPSSLSQILIKKKKKATLDSTPFRSAIDTERKASVDVSSTKCVGNLQGESWY